MGKRAPGDKEESWYCSRCSESFKTNQELIDHQKFHRFKPDRDAPNDGGNGADEGGSGGGRHRGGRRHGGRRGRGGGAAGPIAAN